MPECFSAVADAETARMIIGSMPGVASLNANEYYAHPRNAFWKIVARLYDAPYPFYGYGDKLSLLLKNNIGLWDVYASCERKGSLDSDITDGVVNDFETFLALHPKVGTLYFNGGKAFRSFTAAFKNKPFVRGLTLCPLPSTSPANARLTFEDKVKAWAAIKSTS